MKKEKKKEMNLDEVENGHNPVVQKWFRIINWIENKGIEYVEKNNTGVYLPDFKNPKHGISPESAESRLEEYEKTFKEYCKVMNEWFHRPGRAKNVKTPN